ncbi:MAG TPA: YcnI family protein [Candidatus Saccharimonadales bacterium]|jgi:uncharacterized protein YcnI
MRRFAPAITTGIFTLLTIVALPAAAFAHVTVTPKEAGAGSRTTFTASVPNEKEVPVTGLKLNIPAGLKSVQPTVHAGWQIETTKDGAGDINTITWSGGTIPAGQRDDFTFRGMLPAAKGDLQWKAYQTYADGTTVAWDQAPTKEETEGGNTGPYSVTKVVDDLAAGEKTAATAATTPESPSNTLPLALSLLALVLSAIALTRRAKAGQAASTTEK